jgi:hypothetical protein
LKFRSPPHRNVARNLPRRAPARIGEDPNVLLVSYRLAGDRTEAIKLAKQFLTLKLTRYPDITLPEAVFFVLCEAEQEEFEFQKEWNGGKIYHGSAVIDFWFPNQQTVVRVQGNYWHSKPDRIAEDEVQRAALLQGTIDGKRILNVLDVWENKLLGPGRRHVVRAAIQGVELGK